MQKIGLRAGLIVLALAGHPARAGGLYAFGDSLSDNGNLYKLIHYPPPPYAGGRFSNGPVWVEYLPGLTGLGFGPGNDYAVGGAYTGDISFDGVNYGTNLEGAGLPGISTEIARFAATGQRFGRGDVVTLWGGANNYFRYAALIEADPAAANAIISQGVASTISQLNGDAEALAGLGARTLLVANIPDFGITPDYNNSPIAEALGADISNRHNAALPGIVTALHARTGANIIVLNEDQLLSAAVANPARFGFVNVTDACIDTPSCAGGSAAAQSGYLFWDGVHPTTHTHEIIAKYAAASLLGFESLTVPAQLGAAGARDFAGLLDNRMQALRDGAGGFAYDIGGAVGSNGDPDRNFALFIAGGGGAGYRDNDPGTDLGFTYDNTATILGGDYRLGPDFSAGIAFGYGDDHAKVNEGGKVENTAFNTGIYVTAGFGDLNIESSGSYGDDWYRTSRAGAGYGGVTGKPRGASYTGGIEAGYPLKLGGGVGVTPQAGVSYADAALQGYTEAGDPLVTQQVSSQGYQEILAITGFTVSKFVQAGGLMLLPYVSAASQIHLRGEGHGFSSGFTDEPLVTQTDSYPRQPAAWALLGAGASASLSSRLTASVSLSGTAFRANGNDFSASGAVSWQF